MTLDEAIRHAEEVANKCEFDTDWGMGNHFIDRSGVADEIKCGEEHRQLAEWLRDYKQMLEKKYTLDEEQEQIDFVRPHKRIPVTLNVSSDCISRQAVLQAVSKGCREWRGIYGRCEEFINALPSVKPQEPKTGHISIDDVMSVFDDFMCGEFDEDGTNTFLEMLKDKAESEG